ncbi:MAG: hypothetical protein AB7I30_18910 [Isosphaeraceae bacterium]
MRGRTVLGMIAGREPQQRLEVSLRQGGDGRLTIDLREQHHAEGIGWFDQRTLELEPSQLRRIQAMLGMGEARAWISDDEEAPRATIPFPGPSTVTPRRQAVGDEG